MSKFFSRTPSGSNMAGMETTAKRSLLNGKMGGGAWLGVSTVMNVSSGDDLGTGLAKAGVETALWSYAPMLMTAHTLATTVPDMAIGFQQWKRKQEDQYKLNYMRGTVGGNYMDTQRAATMRQASVEAINGSKLNARSALGGEAKILAQNQFRNQKGL
ncbi:hypothetical protein [Bacillus cereus]